MSWDVISRQVFERIAKALEAGVVISQEQLKLTKQAMAERQLLMEDTAANEAAVMAMLNEKKELERYVVVAERRVHGNRKELTITPKITLSSVRGRDKNRKF